MGVLIKGREIKVRRVKEIMEQEGLDWGGQGEDRVDVGIRDKQLTKT